MSSLRWHFAKWLLAIVIIEFTQLFSVYGQILDFREYSNPDIEISDAYLHGNIYQKDFLLFINMLQESHPAFAYETDYPFDIDKTKEDGYKWAEQCRSAKDLWIYMQSTTALLHDGHTTLAPAFTSDLIYPFSYFIDGDNFYMRGINKEYESVLGKRISLINEHRATDVIQGFKKLISYENQNHFESQVNNYMQTYSMWEYTSFALPDSCLHITFTDSTSIKIKPVPKNKLNIVWHTTRIQQPSIRQNNKLPFSYVIVANKSICYLQFNSCIDQSSLRFQLLAGNPGISEEEVDKRISFYPRFDHFLQEMFDTIKKEEIKTLVVDVRNNGGGNSKLCDILLSWLKPIETIEDFTSDIRFSELWRSCYPKLAADYEKSFREPQKPFKMGDMHNNSVLSSYMTKSQSENKSEKYFMMNNDDNMIFDGNIIFIQDSKTYSSAGILVTKAIDNNIGIVIGEKSSFKPCHYGDMLSWILPNTQISGYVSHKIFYRPDAKKCYEDYLLPTIYLQPTWNDVLENRDICWEWILKNTGYSID